MDNSATNTGDKMSPPQVEGVRSNHQQVRPNVIVHAGGKKKVTTGHLPDLRTGEPQNSQYFGKHQFQRDQF